MKYLAADITAIAGSYQNLGGCLGRQSSQPAKALAAHLTAALIYALTGIGGTGDDGAGRSVRNAAIDLRAFGPDDTPPRNVADLCDRLANIEGTDLATLITRLSPDPETAEQTLHALITQARELAESSPADTGEAQSG